jgi:arylsulfatase A-like enzyme
MIISWPNQVTSAGLRRQYVHAIDIVPTLYSVLGIDPPEVVKGYTQYSLEGVSFDATFNEESATTDKQTQFYSMGGTRAIWHQGWKAAATSPAAPDAWAHYATQRWELFNTDEDPSECHDLADTEPEKLQETHPAVVGPGGPVRSVAAGEP